MEEVPPDEEIKTRRGDEPSKMAVCLCVLCCCCLIIGGVVAVLFLVVFKKATDAVAAVLNDLSFPPTTIPLITLPPATLVPVSPPTLAPTKSFSPTGGLPESVLISVSADTSLKDGEFSSFSDGTEDSLLILNGDNTTSSSRILLSFNLSSIPTPGNIFDTPKSATLHLEHIVGISQSEATNVSIVRLPSTSLLIESLSSDLYQPTGGIDGPTFLVEPTDGEVSVDITDLLFDAMTRGRRGLRRMQSTDQLLLMLEARGAGNGAGGIEFRR
jgi:hypothetical protein